MNDLLISKILTQPAALRRLTWLLIVALFLLAFLSVQPASAAGLTVNSLADSVVDDGACTLREAIINANNDDQSGSIDCAPGSGTDTITFDSSVFTPGTITLSAHLTFITTDMDIVGLGAELVTVDGANSYRPFTINNNATVNLSGLTITNGKAGQSGGIANNGGTLTVSNSTLTNNVGTSSLGSGAISNDGGVLTVSNSTLSGNSANYGGGGISNDGGTLTVNNSTLTDNSATDGGGIYTFGGTALVTNSTLYGNSAGGGSGIFAYTADVTVNNSILGGGTGADCSYVSDVTNFQNSLVEDGSCGVTAGVNGNLTGDPMLDTLADNGGPTQTMALLSGSPAFNTGSNALAVDADGNPLIYDQRGSGYDRIAGLVDMGAYEVAYIVDLVVDRTDDLNLTTCSTAPNDCTLRGAINLANTLSGADTITFDSSVFAPGTITLSAGLPTITSLTDIIGPGSDQVLIDGANSYRPFTIGGAATVTMSGLTITNGSATLVSGIDNSGDLTLDSVAVTNNTSVGGVDPSAVIVNDGKLTVTSSTFSGNSSPAGFAGGAILNNGGTLTVADSTFSDNTGAFGGGGISDSGGGSVTVTGSTFTGNAASNGGAIFTFNGDVTVVNSTIYNNSAGGGLYNYSGTMTVINTTISGNSGGGIRGCCGTSTLHNSIAANSPSGSDCSSSVTVQNSLIEDGSCGVTAGVNGNLTGDPLLDALADNGGPTQTMALLPGSPAIDTADDATCAGALINNLDQRGFTRPNGEGCDMGSYEDEAQAPTAIKLGHISAATTPPLNLGRSIIVLFALLLVATSSAILWLHKYQEK